MPTEPVVTPRRLRIHLDDERIIEADPPIECKVGGVNWPLCALGIDVHVGCLSDDVQARLPWEPTTWLRRRSRA